MAHFQEIDDAIAAHAAWKIRLKDAIATGTLDVSVATIRCNDRCVFGKWLYGTTLSAADRGTACYKTVVELHTQFHKAAANIAELALAGKKAEADQAMGSGGEFAQISSKLTMAMVEWKKNQQPVAARS